MASADPPAGNAEQLRYWNETAGPKWVTHQAVLDHQLGPLGRHVMDRAGIVQDERIIDVGCGCGDTTIELGRRVGTRGGVLGLDPAGVMVARARERVRDAGLAHVTFEQADAQTHPLSPAAYDLVYSRFGVMFFTDPVAAFRNLRGALSRGGRLAFVCWQALARNAWLSVPLQAAARHITLPPPSAPGTPGPFSFADPERVRGILGAAGFADVTLEDVQQTLTLGGGGGLDEVVRLLLEGVGPTSAALREAPPEARERVGVAVREALEPFHHVDGVRMPSAAWVVRAIRESV